MKTRLLLSILALGLLIGGPLRAEGMSADTPSASGLTAEIIIGTGMENKELVGVSDTFSADTPQLVGWTRIKGAHQPTEIRHVWKVNGKEVTSVSLSVQSSSYRTYSRKTLNGQVGNWSLEVKDVDGNVIASKNFEVTASAHP